VVVGGDATALIVVETAQQCEPVATLFGLGRLGSAGSGGSDDHL
jgi:hypothetical protein